MFVKDFIDEYARYRAMGEKAMAQVSDEGLNRVVAPDGNSIAMIVRHVSGNLVSRFTDFLTADGEKPSRNRDGEFADGTFTRGEIDTAWKRGWSVLDSALTDLDENDLTTHRHDSRPRAHGARGPLPIPVAHRVARRTNRVARPDRGDGPMEVDQHSQGAIESVQPESDAGEATRVVTVLIEACVDSVASAVAAERGRIASAGAVREPRCWRHDAVHGADRRGARARRIPVMVMIRPRGGSYVSRSRRARSDAARHRRQPRSTGQTASCSVFSTRPTELMSTRPASSSRVAARHAGHLSSGV